MSLNGVLLGIGNPLLDISAVVGQDTLDKYGVTLNNAILAEEKHQPLYADLVENFKVDYVAGGATQNSIRVAQWMLPAEATNFIGSVGQDKFSEALVDSATADGVHVHYSVDEKTPTGTCAVLVKDGERSLVANLAAANNYTIEHLKTPEMDKVLKMAKFYYAAGFFLTVSPESLQHIAEHAAATNKVLAMNLSAPFICQFFKDPLMAAIPYCDIVFGNESEAIAFGETQGYENPTPISVAEKIADMQKVNKERTRMVVITQGAESTIVVENGVVVEFPVKPMDKALIVDTNGAGDAFVGGFLSSLIQGGTTAENVQKGVYAAQTIIQTPGCALPSSQPDFKGMNEI